MTARDRIVVLVVLIAAAIFGSWTLLISPKRQQAGKLGAEVQAQQSQLDAARSKVAAGEAAKNAFSRNYTQLAQLGEAVPADDNVPSLIFQIQSAATKAKVDFHSLQVNASSSAAPAPPPTPGTTPAPAATLPPGVTAGPAGLPAEQFTFTFQGNFFRLSDFLNRLQRLVVVGQNRISIHGRLMTLNAISLGAGTGGFPHITATISATSYLVPASQGTFAGATPAGPAGATSSGSTPASTSTSAPAPTAAITPPVR
jgi:hypothetical protein